MIFNGREHRIRLRGKEYHGAVDVTMDRIGGKWKAIVLWYLRRGTKRFSALHRLMPGITEKMLSIQLRQLEKDGLVKRTIHPEVPPRVEYELSEEGLTLLPLLEEIARWGRELGDRHGSVEEVPERKRPARGRAKARGA